MLEIGILKNFDPATYRAGVQLAGSLTTYFDDISVSVSIPSSALVLGNYVIVAIPNGNPKDACVIASWPGGSASGENWVVQLTNKSGASTQEGYVYRLDPDNNDSFDYASEDEDAQVAVAKGVIANNAAGDMVIGGYEDVYVNATTTRGDYLYFSSTNGQAKPSKLRYDGCIGIATASRTGAGLVKAYIFPKERIRKWAWADEQGWRGHYILPVDDQENIQKYSAGNPIIPVGTGWESAHTSTPKAIISENQVKVYYYGATATLYQIGLAYVPIDAIEGSYTKHPNNPILPQSQAWEIAGGGKGIFSPSVIYDPDAPNTGTDYKYKMWYAGGIAGTAPGIGYAYSADGISWTKYSGNPVITAGFGDGLHTWPASDVIRFGKIYFLAYRNAASNNSVCYSSNGINWTNLGVSLSVGSSGQWDDTMLGFGSFYHSQGNVYFLYHGRNSAGVGKIGMAMQTMKELLTGTYQLTKYFRNPILSSNNPGSGSWDTGKHLRGSMIQYKNIFYIYYGATDASGKEQIGLAYIKR